MIISYQGRIVAPDEAHIPITSTSLQFGQGVFESFLITEGKAFQLQEHLQRFIGSSLAVKLPYTFTPSELTGWVASAFHAAPSPVSRVKVLGTSEGVWVLCQPIDPVSSAPWKLQSYQGRRSLAEIKSTSYLECLLAHQNAVEAGADEALLCNHHGKIYEGSRSNFYWIAQGRLRSKNRGVLPGITREFIAKNHPGGIHWEGLNIDQLEHIQGAMVSNAVRGLIPVCQIDQHPIPVSDQVNEVCSWFNQERAKNMITL